MSETDDVQQNAVTTLQPSTSLRPVELGRAVGLSASSIRAYERLGFIPLADRTASGHRRYGTRHVTAVQAARVMQRGYGWEPALVIMRAVLAGDVEAALAGADRRHAELSSQRRDLAEVRSALDQVRRRPDTTQPLRLTHGRTTDIGTAATSLGIATSAIRYWESRGVVQSTRQGNRRCFNRDQYVRLHIVKLLRDSDYRFPAIAAVLDTLTDATPAKLMEALDVRQLQITAASMRAAEATRALIGLLATSSSSTP